MLTDLKVCENCGFFGQREQMPAIDNAVTVSDVMIVFDRPPDDTKLQRKVEKWFFTMFGKFFDLKTAEDTKRSYYYTYAVNCCCSKDHREQPSEVPPSGVIKTCGQYLWAEIQRVNPKLILVCGRTAFATLFGGKGKLDSKRGRLIKAKLSQQKVKAGFRIVIDEEHGTEYTILPVFSIYQVYDNLAFLKIFLNDLSVSAQYVGNKIIKDQTKFTLVSNNWDLQEMIDTVNRKEYNFAANDVETESTTDDPDDAKNWQKARLTLSGWSFGHWRNGKNEEFCRNYVIDYKKYKNEGDDPAFNKEVLFVTLLHKIPAVKYLCGFNYKFDLKVQRKYGRWPAFLPDKKILDVQLLSYLLDNERFGMKTTCSLEDLLTIHFPGVADYKKRIKDKKKATPAEDVFYNPLYNARDSQYTAKITKYYWDMLHKPKHKPLRLLYHFVYSDLIQILAGMEYRGVKIDVERLLKLKASSEENLKQLDARIRKCVFLSTNRKEFARTMSLTSAKDKKKLLFEYWNLPVLSKTKKGTPMLRKNTLTQYEAQIRMGKIQVKSKYIRKFFALIKARTLAFQHYSTFILGIYKNLDSKGRIHTTYGLTGTKTGRLSSSGVNLENIPRETTNSEIKQLFITTSDVWTMYDMDLSQIEMRLLAFFSEDASLINAFNKSLDVHLSTAAKIAGVPYEQAAKEYAAEKSTWKKRRTSAKSTNFGISYGLTNKGLAQQLSNYETGEIVDEEEAQQFIDEYFEIYPGVKDYMDQIIEFVHKHGYVETLCGRRRYLANINSEQRWVVEGVERQAINMPIQGTAADFFLFMMVRIYRELYKRGIVFHYLLTVYDSLCMETKEDVAIVHSVVDRVMAMLHKMILSAFGVDFTVKLDYDKASGKVWGALTEIKA
jgi:DNA polymerase I-like protein with 3'-5' exonuclease and polymerase domains/uracil-DNA glycosylase